MPASDRQTAASQSPHAFLASIANYRALAIFSVVLSHSTWSLLQQDHPPLDIIFHNVVSGATTYFVFISGFMFQHMHHTSFDTRKILAAKYIKLLIPFLVLAVPMIALRLALESHNLVEPIPQVIGRSPIESFFIYLWSGRYMTAYWYIPYLSILMLMYPLFFRYLKLATPWRIAILLASVALSFLVPRSPTSGMAPQMLVHFQSFFFFGAEIAKHRQLIIQHLSRYTLLFLIAGLGFATAQYAQGQIGALQGPPFAPPVFNFSIVQKYCLILFWFLVLERFSAHQPPLLRLLAKTSFTIFLLHGPVLIILRLLLPANPPWGWITQSIGAAMLATAICVAIALTGRRLLGAKSKYLIGY